MPPTPMRSSPRPPQGCGRTSWPGRPRDELRLAPEAVASPQRARQAARAAGRGPPQESGNASLAGRELDTADVIASKAHIDAIAVRLRDSGLIEGRSTTLRALALMDLTRAVTPSTASSPAGRKPSRPRTRPRPRTPWRTNDVPARPAGPGAAAGPDQPPGPGRHPARLGHRPRPGGWACWTPRKPGPSSGPHPGTREHAGALRHRPRRHRDRPRLRHRPAPLETARLPSPQTMRKPGDIPAPRQSAQLADLLRRMNVTFEPIARDTATTGMRKTATCRAAS